MVTSTESKGTDAGIFKRLQVVRGEFSKIEVKKTGENSFSKYSYFELGDFLPRAQMLFYENNICPVITFPSLDKAVMTLHDALGKEEPILFESPMAVPEVKGMNAAQAIGAAETYTRRYLYMTALELAEHSALEDTSADPKGKKDKPQSEIASAVSDIADLVSKCTAAGGPTARKSAAGIIKGKLSGSTDYKSMKDNQIGAANEIKTELDALLKTLNEGVTE